MEVKELLKHAGLHLDQSSLVKILKQTVRTVF